MEGNQMRMREALVKIREKCVIYNNDLAEEIDALCGNALAAPERNCDVYAHALWDKISRAWQKWLLTPEFNKRKIGGLKEFCYWLLAPAAEKGATA